VKTLWFIRHGETDWNREGRLQGQRDIPLNDLGRLQAAEAGRRLMAARPDPGRLPWHVSPLGRTMETAILARTAIGLEPLGFLTDERLMELTFGRWEGQTWHDLKKRERDLARARKADKWNFVPPGGESYALLARRIEPWLAEMPDEAVIVSHGGVARVLLTVLGGVARAEAPFQDIRQGEILRLEMGSHAWI
jgi:broad specificity phosphatase PhoE